MGILLFIFMLFVVPAIGSLIGSTMQAYADPSRALRIRAAGGRTRPPGAFLMPMARYRMLRPGRYELHSAARGLALREGRAQRAAVRAQVAGSVSAGSVSAGSVSAGEALAPAAQYVSPNAGGVS